MKNLLLNSVVAACWILPPYLTSPGTAQANDWGCEVVLCLSNPGGPTQFAECRPPIQKLWRELAEGHSFPTCTGVGFRSSRPGYEPYYCDTGYRLESNYGPRGQETTCVSTALQPVSDAFCPHAGDGYNFSDGSVLSPRWQLLDGRRQCMGYPTARPNVRSQPHYVDVTIDGAATQRVWY
ncbi:hypothetical protein ELI54_02340 [Rhizobium ruizarguesonis]|uniref:Secreted protein n=1 Tax=Rhizobium ruizarguesonis TaxID=2081791 RepID=A0ABY1X492_9HYPH|nr:hypothetical protein [Rhizobium ruizarguesonis]MBY5851219.1 hypothetical protein [Rhizobium leguminosarum]TAT87139.1 hypothetical protein ELI54_02340 [Rhizobium ruizarguesonis]TAU75049.1 hypothetical protein ELI46_02510 [Rhizobium ruizarguesonis]TAV31397.1 hypothetical protein ELI36_02365 [Rhizobium ruizarguesonis]TAV36151.1 hypothetical protein ELI33_02360 [Rhizobium ruizarguesonis]